MGSWIDVTQTTNATNGNVNIAVISTHIEDASDYVYISVTSITQTGVTWTLAKSETQTWYHLGSYYTWNASIWYGIVGSGAWKTLRVNLNGSPDVARADVCEYSGLMANSSIIDKTATATGASATPSTGTTATTTMANELWIGATISIALQANATSGWALIGGAADQCAYLEYIASATGTAHCETEMSSAWYWGGCIATFKTATINATPTIGSGSGTNFDDTNNIYAKKKDYTVSITYSDTDTYSDIRYCELFIKTSGNTTRVEFAYLEDSQTLTTPAGGSQWTLESTSGDFVRSGNDVAATWKIKAHWDATEESGDTFLFFVNDTAGAWVNSAGGLSSFDVVTRLVDNTAYPSTSKARANVGAQVTITAQIRYGNNPGSSTPSSLYPPDSEFNAWYLHNSAHVSQGSSSVSSGQGSWALTLPSTVQNNLYHVYVDYVDADATDADTATATAVSVISDRIRIDSFTTSDADGRLNCGTNGIFYAMASLEYDGHALTNADTLWIAGNIFLWWTDSFQFGWTSSTPLIIAETGNLVGSSEATYGIDGTGGNMNGHSATLIWDRIIINTLTVNTSRTNINNAILYQATAALEYDNPSHTLGSGDSLSLGGVAFSWNSSSAKWEYSTSKATVQAFTINYFTSGTEATYTITVGNENNKAIAAIWDNLIVDVKGTTNSSARLNVNAYAQFYFKLRSQYDGAYVTSGSVTLNGSLSASWIAANSRWEYNTTKTSAQSYGGLYVASATWSTYSITSLSSQTSNYTNSVIWDSVTCYLSPPTFQRVNINVNASGMVKWGKYDYDSASFDGVITLNQTIFTFATVQRQGYNASSISGGTYSITVISGCNATYCIWDSVTCYLSPPTFQRVNINVNASGMVKWGKYDYDSASFDGVITLNQTTLTFATPQRQGYNASSISGGSYPAVTLIVSCNTTYCIWDSITAYISPPTSQRININTNATGMQVWGIFNYDSLAYDGTLALNNTQYSYATAQRQDFNITVASGSSYPQVTIIASSNTTYCIWDNLIVDTKGSTNATARSNVNSYVQYYFKLRSQYDGSYVTSGSVTLNGSISATWVSGNARWEYNTTESSAQSLSFYVDSATWSAYSITSLSSQTGNSTSVIWDRIEIYSKSPDSAVPTGTYAIVWFMARYEYDHANYTSGTLTINGTSSTYNSTGNYWQISVTNASAVNLIYQVSAVSDSTFTLTVYIDNTGLVSVQWYTSNTPPTANVTVPSTVYAYQQVNFSAVLNDADGAYSGSNGLLNCTLSFNVSSVRLNWFAVDNSTSKEDPFGYWSLDAGYTVTVNSTAVNVTWTIRMYWTSTKGGYNVTCIVWDRAFENGTDNGTYTFVDDLVVDSSATFNRARVDPPGSLVMMGQLYYEGTSTPPYGVTGIVVYCALNGTNKGSNSSIASDGSFRISFTTEASPIGTFYYTVYSLTDEVSTTNKTASVILDRIFIQSGGIGSHFEQVNNNVTVYYTLLYESDLSGVTDGTVLLNTTAMIYNGALLRWELNVTSATVGNFTYYVSAVWGNLYGITIINDAVGSQYCFFYSYLNLNVRTVDVDGNPLTETIVYLNNGTAGAIPWEPPGTGVAVVGPSGWYSQVSSGSWANWTGQTNSSVQIYVIWKGLTVNSTFTLPTLTDVTVDVNCFCYPYTVATIRFWCASNATIQTATYLSNVLIVAFNSPPIATYLLVASCTTRPCYITNATYNLNVDFASGYLTLIHYGNVTLRLSYETDWGNLYVKATDHKIEAAAWAGPKLSIMFDGTSGEIGTFSLYCGSAGTPTATSGFITTGFVGNVLSGSYAFSSSSQTVIFDWTSTGGTGTGTGTSGTELNPSTLMVDVSFAVTGSVMRGGTVNGTMNVSWTGYMIIYVWNIQCTGSYSNWVASIAGLPISLTMTGDVGHAQVPVVFTVPVGSSLGNQSIPCSVIFQLPGTSNEKTVTEIASVQVVAPAEPLNIQVWMVVGFIALLAMVPVGALFRTTRERRKYRTS